MKKVLCHGVFDVIHAGHLAYFEGAKKYGNLLIVSVTADRFVNKGPGRPYFTAEQRAGMLRSLRIIDEVIISEHATAVDVISRVKPNFYVKGPDYRDLSSDVTGEILNEKAAVEEHGGQLVFTDEPTFSSGTLINRFLAHWSDEQKAQIEKVQSLGGFTTIKKAIDEISKLKVLVIGEPILDIYRFVNPEGISSKSPSISARFSHEETYHGGVLAIGNHLKGFCANVQLQTPSTSVPKKIRYISGSQRIFEVTHIDDKPVTDHHFNDKILECSAKSDLVILADFGHGAFEGQTLETLKQIKQFLALNVQTNSSNFGFNVFTKHERFDYLCIDTREARLALHDRYSDPNVLCGQITGMNENRWIGMTYGPNGASLSKMPQDVYFSPSFADSVVDATGAGDAYFAITSCLLKTGCHPELIPFIGNVFAGLKCKVVGNKTSVTKASLLKAIEGILK